MINLSEKDPIEFQMKRSQFKANLSQTQSDKQCKGVNQVRCPYCNSTDTKKISTSTKIANTAVFGIFSMSRNSKNYHCNRCGSDF